MLIGAPTTLHTIQQFLIFTVANTVMRSKILVTLFLVVWNLNSNISCCSLYPLVKIFSPHLTFPYQQHHKDHHSSCMVGEIHFMLVVLWCQYVHCGKGVFLFATLHVLLINTFLIITIKEELIKKQLN